MRDAELRKGAVVEDRAVACRSDLLQLATDGLVKEESVGPWIPVRWNIVGHVSAPRHLGIAHVRRCSAHCVDHALKCLQTHEHGTLLRHDSRVLFQKRDRDGHRHSGFGTLALETLRAAALAEHLLRQVTKSREFFCSVLFMGESVDKEE